MTSTQLKAALFFFVSFILWAILSATFRWPNPFYVVIDTLPLGDKIGHFVLMGILSFLVNMILRAQTIVLIKWPVLLGSLIVLVIVTIEELSQGFVATRTLSAADWVADFMGIWFFGRIALHLIQKQEAA